jgi:hypothetical protein
MKLLFQLNVVQYYTNQDCLLIKEAKVSFQKIVTDLFTFTVMYVYIFKDIQRSWQN